MNLSRLKDPSQIQNLSLDELEALASEIRLFLLSSISQTGGHLSSNLGAVELTLALHYVFDSPRDKIIFDVGHQAYTHKILTGRADLFPTLRQKDGLSGFQKRKESEHDPWEAGHSSTSLSAAIGLAAARDIQHQDFHIIPVIGDGALTGGMAMEALNDIGASKRNLIIIFNDNKMSISRNAGGAETALTRLRASNLYRQTKNELNNNLPNLPLGEPLLKILHSSHDYLKHQMLDQNLFSQFNLDYIGPVDGHNLQDLISVLEMAKEHEGPIVIHVVTKKGKGYIPAENDTTGKWHGVSPFDLATGKPLQEADTTKISWSEVISRTLEDWAARDKKLAVITPAMTSGSKLANFEKLYPDRFFDCGIAEEHAMTMASGMAQGGLHPFISIYSSFLQRAYDQIHHDVARMQSPVVIGIDRAGLVGEDGDTHQGIYDIAFLRTIPGVTLSQPKDAAEAQNLMATGFASRKPFFIRYPRGNTAYEKVVHPKLIEIGSWTFMDPWKENARYQTLKESHEQQNHQEQQDQDIEQILITYGPDLEACARMIVDTGLKTRLVNARFFKPVDTAMLNELALLEKPILIYETDTVAGGLSSAVLEAFQNMPEVKTPHIEIIGIEDCFVPHGSVEALKKELGISIDQVQDRLLEMAGRKPAAGTSEPDHQSRESRLKKSADPGSNQSDSIQAHQKQALSKAGRLLSDLEASGKKKSALAAARARRKEQARNKTRKKDKS